VYRLVRQASVRELALTQAPALAASFVVAELFYKFHSFTLECAAFLATWAVIDFLTSLVTRMFASDPGGESTAA